MKKIILMGLSILLICSLAGCGNKDSVQEAAVSEMNIAMPADAGGAEIYKNDAMTEEAVIEEAAAVVEEPMADTGEVSADMSSTSAPVESMENSSRKFITTADMSIKTGNFDELTASIEKKVTEAGGYIENTSLDSGEYSENLRNAYYTLRIPEEKLDPFLDMLKGSGKIVSQSRNVQDVTLNYTAVDSHIKALKTEEETLLGLLERAENVADILEIQRELANVRADLECYESQKRLYDNQISYATLTLHVQEEGVVLSSGQTIPGVYVVLFVVALLIVIFGILFVIFYFIFRKAKKKEE